LVRLAGTDHRLCARIDQRVDAAANKVRQHLAFEAEALAAAVDDVHRPTGRSDSLDGIAAMHSLIEPP
jgi:hypothetical protein